MMIKIINGKKYNTETSTFIGEDCSSFPRSDFKWWEEALYQTKKGQFFIAGTGGAMSKYATQYGNSYGSGNNLYLISEEEALAWAENHLDPKDTEQYFSVEEG